MPWSTSIASASRVNASTTVSARNRRPSNGASETKSIGHISFAAEPQVTVPGWRLTLRLGLLSRRAQSIIPVEQVNALVVHELSFPQ